MSCLDVMYHHQTYGAHQYSSTSAVAAAAAYKAAYYHHHHHHHHHQQQQKKLGAFGKMQDAPDVRVPRAKQPAQGEEEEEEEERGEEEEEGEGEGAQAKEPQPAETEYLSSRCVLLTYFRGDIGDVVDQHFSRALSQPGGFSPDRTPASRAARTPASSIWKEGGSLSGGQCMGFPASFWNSSYHSQSAPGLPGIQAEFSPATAFHSPESSAWGGHGLPHSPAVPDSWHYPLGAPTSPGYPHVHEVYSHMHHRRAHPAHPHAHPMLHPAHGSALDPRYGPLLLPNVHPACNPAPHCDVTKSEPDPAPTHTQTWPAVFHTAVDVGFDTAPDQEKGKASVWF
ncbi:transcription cofactor vestigial-like protein 3 [Lepisosteus oculatus]|uniref:transcription cofactor vestigial-like protein 3 n=1 Tax=Lepisosteus oculatus TaxID=7918 RepID=UPI0035F5214A